MHIIMLYFELQKYISGRSPFPYYFNDSENITTHWSDCQVYKSASHLFTTKA